MQSGVAPASISFDKDGHRLRATVGDVLSMEAEEILGLDQTNPGVITNATLAVAQPIRQSRAGDVRYHDHWDAEFSGTNGFTTDFGKNNNKNITLLWNPAMNVSFHLVYNPNSVNAVFTEANLLPPGTSTPNPNKTSSWSLGMEYSF